MPAQQPPILFSFDAGTYFATRVRISWFLAPMLPFAWWYYGLKLGTIVFLVAFVSVLIHEFAHIAAARFQGVRADEILIWPLGGLAFVGQGSPWIQIWTAAAGPLSNLLICGAMLYPAWQSGNGWKIFDPMVMKITDEVFYSNVSGNLAVTVFAWNWILFLVNLLPAMPLDGGNIVRSSLALHLTDRRAKEASITIGFGCGLVVIVYSCMRESTLLCSLAWSLILYGLYEWFQLQVQVFIREAGLGESVYGEGYGSAETEETPEQKLSMWQRWKARREAERQKKEAASQLEAEQKLDVLLSKVHEKGIDSLTEAEKRQLKLASERIRKVREDK